MKSSMLGLGLIALVGCGGPSPFEGTFTGGSTVQFSRSSQTASYVFSELTIQGVASGDKQLTLSLTGSTHSSDALNDSDTSFSCTLLGDGSAQTLTLTSGTCALNEIISLIVTPTVQTKKEHSLSVTSGSGTISGGKALTLTANGTYDEIDTYPVLPQATSSGAVVLTLNGSK